MALMGSAAFFTIALMGSGSFFKTHKDLVTTHLSKKMNLTRIKETPLT